MELEKWTDLEVVDCPKVNSRVATQLAMAGLRNLDPGPEYTDVYCTLDHCTGSSQCGLVLPANSSDMMRFDCPMSEVVRKKFGIHPRPQLVS